MRTTIENWLLRHWYGQHQPPWYLRVLEPVYRAGYQWVKHRNQTSTGINEQRLPLIVVGNITAGGSGKTPMVIKLCQLAMELNLKAGIASRGYGRKSRETLVVQADSDTLSCGDEPVLLARRTGVPVVVAANRLDAVKRLNQMDLDLIFSDDGLQRADLDRDIEICMVDGARGLGNGHLIPAGPLREPASRLKQVDYVVSNGEWAVKPADMDVYVMQLRPGVLRSLDDTEEYPVDEFRHLHSGTALHAIAGIGHPQRFFSMLESLGLQADSHGFADHHVFTSEDFKSIRSDTAIIMTEKDAVKCRTLGLVNAWYMPVDTYLPGELESRLKDQLVKLIRECK